MVLHEGEVARSQLALHELVLVLVEERLAHLQSVRLLNVLFLPHRHLARLYYFHQIFIHVFFIYLLRRIRRNLYFLSFLLLDLLRFEETLDAVVYGALVVFVALRNGFFVIVRALHLQLSHQLLYFLPLLRQPLLRLRQQLLQVRKQGLICARS